METEFVGSTKNPKDSVKAKKFVKAIESAETVVKNISWQVGKSNKLTPVIEFEPIDLSGASVSKASMYNFKLYSESGIGIGSVIEVTRSGDVIPKILSVKTKKDLVLPTVKYRLSESKTDAYFETEEIQPIAIQKYFEYMGIDGVGPIGAQSLHTRLETLDWEGFFKLTQDDYAIALGTYTGIRVYGENWELLRNKELFVYDFYAALGTFGDGFGPVRIEPIIPVLESIIFHYGTITEDLIEMSPISAVGKQKVIKNLDKFFAHRNIISEHKIIFSEKKVIESSKFKVAFTGFRDAQLEEFIKHKGGSIVNSGFDVLVVLDTETTSNKLKEAIAKNKEILVKELAYERYKS
jgi:NAD-dependent DNA ligase